jgi:hypothetical protein
MGHTVMLNLGPPLIDISFGLGQGNNELTFDLIFSKLAGEVREKQSRKTSVWGYDNGRSRLGTLASLLYIMSTAIAIAMTELTRNPPVRQYPTNPTKQSIHPQ